MTKAVACGAMIVVTLAGTTSAAITYKSDVALKGVPDLAQGDSAICSAAAWADAMWYYQNDFGKTGLVKHTNANNLAQAWEADGNALRDAIADRYYGKAVDGKREGGSMVLGVLEYIAVQRPQDLKKATVKGREVTKLDWHYSQSSPKKATDVEASIAAVMGAGADPRKKYSVAVLDWYGQLVANGPVARLNVLDAEGKAVERGGRATALSHELGIAGLDSANGKFVVTNGHGNNAAANPNRPVHNSYYDQLTYTRGAAGADPFRVTDNGLKNVLANLQQNVPGNAGARLASYAEVTAISTINADTPATVSAGFLKRVAPPRDPSPGAGVSYEVILEYVNTSDAPVGDVFIEIPWISQAAASLGAITPVDIPAGWTPALYDPNQDARWDVLTGENGDGNALTFNSFGFTGLSFLTGSSLLQPGESVVFEFTIDGFALVVDADWKLLKGGTWNANDELAGGVVPTPGVGALLLAAAFFPTRRRA